jgi:hypothetical protein
MNKNEINIINKDWEGICFLENSQRLVRKDILNEYGSYEFGNNKIIIIWDNWGKEDFYKIDKNEYIISTLFFKKYLNYDFYEKMNLKYKVIFNIDENYFYTIDKKINIQGKYVIDNDFIILYFENQVKKKYVKINDEMYFLYDEFINIFFELCIDNKIFLFNKPLNEFYDKKIFTKLGKFQMSYDKLTLLYSSEHKEVYYVKNVYKILNEKESIVSNNNTTNNKLIIEDNNFRLIYPKKVMIKNRVLFSNITLYKKKIILTSIFYKEDSWNVNNINFNIKNTQIINKTIYENNHFESSLSIILDLEKVQESLELSIEYTHNKTKHFFNVSLKQSFKDINNIFLGAMTLFKDDYKLLKQYIKYYENLGISFFYFYYNGQFNNELLIEIKGIINSIRNDLQTDIIVYLVQWDYQYWWNPDDKLNKHHHAQTMALNDSLNIMKNFCKYVLYNDLDEFCILKKYNNFIDMINYNNNVDIFTFKNRFCKMGNNLIKYEDLYEKFDLNDIIQGNYWDTGREKNLFKIENINVMGVHNYYEEFSPKLVMSIKVGEFYHIINFEEKERLYLMTEYIVI